MLLLFLVFLMLFNIGHALERCWRYADVVVKHANYYHLLYGRKLTPMFLAQIEVESACNSRALAPDGGMGLGQFMPLTWEEMKRVGVIPVDSSPYDAYYNIKAMVYYDTVLYNIKPCRLDWHYALRKYNGGVKNLMKEVKLAGGCYPYELVDSYCKRTEFFCRVNTSYPRKIFTRSRKYERISR